jgi:hypothetical protein
MSFLKTMSAASTLRTFCILTCLTLCSCGSLQVGGLNPITRAIEVKGVQLHEPWQFSIGMSGPIIYPSGLYEPFAQNAEGTFYKCIHPVRTIETSYWMQRRGDSGFYLRDDQVDGLHIWARNGEMIGRRPISKINVQPSFSYK